jgi:hypothetical protein
MSFRTFLTAAAVVLVPLSACAPDSSEPAAEENASEESAVAGDTVYQVTRPDYRKCASPMCGGVFIKAVNKTKTKCFDGSSQDECYVADIDDSKLGLTGEQADEVRLATLDGKVLLSAELVEVQDGYANLLVHKAYQAETGHAVTGSYWLVEPSGITCIKAPCPNFHARKLNSSSTKLITDIDLSSLGLDEARQSEIMNAVFETHIIVSGSIASIATQAGTEKRLTVSEVFDTVEATTALCLADDDCGSGSHCDHSECLSGCADGQICPAVCYGACVPGDAPVCPGGGTICQAMCTGGDIDIPEGCPVPACDCPIQKPGSCFAACGGAAPDKSCYCDDGCAQYGDCCSDYASQCL